MQNRFQNGFKNWFGYPKLMSKSIPHGGSGASFWGVGWSFWANIGSLGGLWLPSASWEVFWAALGWSKEPR